MDIKRAQAFACALKVSVTGLIHGSLGSETSGVQCGKTKHIQHEAHSFLLYFLYHSTGIWGCQDLNMGNVLGFFVLKILGKE
jgi:hypothetical protein